MTGLIPCIDGRPMPHDTYAHTDAVLLHIPADSLRRRRMSDPSIAAAIELQLAARARRFYDMASDFVLSTPRSRLRRLLRELGSEYGEEGEDGRTLTPRVTQSELADLLGTSRQWTNKELRERAGVLTIHRSQIVIHRLDQLAPDGTTAPSTPRPPATQPR